MSEKGRQVRARLRRGGAIGLAAACALLVASAALASIASARVLPILVTGDSYSAGNGAGDYFGAKGCWRSPNNYAGVFARALQLAPYNQPTVLDNVACSGDTTRAFAHWTHGRRPQLDAVNKGYGVIFLTVGGDDIDFAGIVQNCLIQISRDGRKCNALLSTAEKDVRDGTLERHIIDVLDGIRQRAGSEARIVLLGYPYIEGQENYLLPYGHGKSIDVPRRLRALEDLGDQVQQRAVNRLNAKYRTSAFVFVKTKGLFAGHELDALSLNPNRWFVAPETDAGLAWRAWWYHPNPTGWYEEAQLLLSDPNVPKHPAAKHPMPQTWRDCPSYSVTQTAYGYTTTTHLHRLQVQGVSCHKMRQILHGFFFGPNSPAGPLPSDGIRVGSWVVLLRMDTVWGQNGSRHIRGQYTVT